MPTGDRTVVFVAPYLAPATLRFVDATARLDGVRLGLVTSERESRIPTALKQRLGGWQRMENGLDADEIARAVERLARRIGRPRRLLGALEELQVPLARVRERLAIEGPGVAVAQNFRDKSRMKEVLRAAGVPCARHRLARSAGTAMEFAQQIGFPLVAKPPAGAAARDTFRVDDADGLRRYLALMPPLPERPLMLEEYIVGEEHSFDTVSVEGRPVWHSLTHYRPGPLEVMRQPWIQWTVLLPREIDHPRYDDVRRVAFRALEALGMETGLSHLEWFRRPDGSIAVSEVAARPPGAQFTTLISYAHDVDFYRAWAELVVFGRFDPPPRRYAAGIAFLRGQGRGRVHRILGLEAAQEELGPLVVEVSLPQPGQPPASSYEGEGYVVLRHPDTAVVARGLERLVRLIRVELAG